MRNSKVAIAYVPVLHAGYLRFIESLLEEGVQTLYLVSDDILASHEELDYINRKDRLRALPSAILQKLVQNLTTCEVRLLTIPEILAIHETRSAIIAPAEDISRFIIETYFLGHIVEYRSVFLRWNRDVIEPEHEAEGASRLLRDEFARSALSAAVSESEKSADWWRQVGAVLTKNGEVIAVAHNEHLPEEELPNILGDTRSLYKKGVHVDYTTAAHAEVGVIGEAARKGINTEGAELFVTDFPCPYCARLIAKSGIKKVYFLQGYAVVGGEEFFKDMGIVAVRVSLE